MRGTKDWIIVSAVTLLLTGSSVSIGQYSLPPKTSGSHQIILHNSDVLSMVKKGMKADAITKRILTSTCNFDVFPPVLEDLRRRGVPDVILQLMTVVPNGPPAYAIAKEEKPPTAVVTLPRGFSVQVETLYPVSSANFKEGNSVALAVVEPVYVEGVLVVARGTVARAKIISLKRAKNLGRGGELTWRIDEIRAVDGTKIPVRLIAAATGNNNGGQLAAGVAATAAIIFPYTAPAAVVWAFKKGDDAVVRGSKRFAAVSTADIEVAGIVPEKDRVFYHYANSLTGLQGSSTTAAPASFPRFSVRH